MRDLLNKYQIILSEDISSICNPLTEFGITFFHYMQRFNDNSRIHISNVPEWVEHFYQQDFHLLGVLQGKNDNYPQEGCFLWSTLKNQDIYQDCREYFNIDHGITIIKKQPKSIEFFHFGTSRDKPGIENFYLTNLDILYRFIIYFKDSANPLLEKARKNRIHIPNYNNNPDILDLSIVFGTDSFGNKLKQKAIAEFKIKKYALNLDNEKVIFSKREVDCLLGMLEGKQASEIGRKLYISKRTVETHLDHIRQKLNCKDKSELIKILMRKGLTFHGQLWKVFS
ncbi:MAG: hypothetical protein A2X78_01935 [Gammaproteobacteria bacterium GWE2_37_16]|nr:MAG: hypothetical protein A2X78_01935 [Gammaproteobacteria bacterium GWE2_37_16]